MGMKWGWISPGNEGLAHHPSPQALPKSSEAQPRGAPQWAEHVVVCPTSAPKCPSQHRQHGSPGALPPQADVSRQHNMASAAGAAGAARGPCAPREPGSRLHSVASPRTLETDAHVSA